MRVRMTVAVSGTRNGKDWPPAGGTIDLPEDEAKNLIAIGVAAEGGDEETAAAPADEETATPGGRPSTQRKPAPKPAK